ncbi:MAG TPA: nodulation protein NfeD, partial [Firmicutes bacterium]|nr:nodulation protein NfeD [Bacillota bacterium]
IIRILLVLFLLLWVQAIAGGAEKTVCIIPLEGPVEKGLTSFLNRSFREAARENADVVILEIDTPGGYLDAAFDISKLIQRQEVPIYAYITHKAYSAGAYLALSCERIYMSLGSVMGAAEPRSFFGGEEAVDEKTVSAFEGAMRSAAEARGRKPEIAAAMVRKELAIEGVVEEGRLLTLTEQKAKELNYSEGTFNTRNELLAGLGLEDARIVETKEGAAEKLARLVTNPSVATILLTIGITALILEVMTAGFGLAGIISILAFALFFGGHIFAGLAGYEVLALFMLGVVLLLIEAFIPGFGIIGIAGILAVGAAVAVTVGDTGRGLSMFLVSLILSGILIAIAFTFFAKKGLFRSIVLNYREDKELGYVGPRSFTDMVGKRGKTVTPLRPAGIVMIEGGRYDVVSDGGFIPAGQEVYVSSVEGMRLVVKPLE